MLDKTFYAVEFGSIVKRKKGGKKRGGNLFALFSTFDAVTELRTRL